MVRNLRHFNPRSPCGELLVLLPRPSTRLIFHPTPPVRGATVVVAPDVSVLGISTHAPRAGSDTSAYSRRRQQRDFNPRSPCGERPLAEEALDVVVRISTHAPRAGSDCSRPASTCRRKHFNPRSPCGERRRGRACDSRRKSISTHAPRAGSDPCARTPSRASIYFNPRSPCGERRSTSAATVATTEFQPTLPVRGATATYCISDHRDDTSRQNGAPTSEINTRHERKPQRKSLSRGANMPGIFCSPHART